MPLLVTLIVVPEHEIDIAGSGYDGFGSGSQSERSRKLSSLHVAFEFARSPGTVVHVAPVHTPLHVQVNDASPSVHAPAFWHGFGEHSSISVRQSVPVYPALHEPHVAPA